MRSIGALLVVSQDDPENVSRFAAFAQGLQEAGWTIGGNVRLETRLGNGDLDLYRKYALELAALAPDVVLAHGSSVVQALLAASRNLPIVFVSVVDPVGAGFVASLARPQGNATGFSLIEYSIGAK
jgi:putative ABC transport system substrate-binding protein